MRWLCAIALALVAALASASASAATTGLQVTELKSASFPDRTLVLTLPKPAALTAGVVSVLENGQAVNNLSLKPVSVTEKRTFGVILVIDASDSMLGAAIADAVDAARAFAAHRTDTESLGLITFNTAVRMVVRPTTDAQVIDAALRSTPPLGQGTLLYDATAQAVDMLKAGKIEAGSIVLLTDGADTGSRLGLARVVAKASDAGVRVFAVGLRSRQYSPAPLRQLATATGAAYAEARSASSLTGIYTALSKRLANEYLLRYRSLAGPGIKVQVEVSAAGFPAGATASYKTASLPSSRTQPFHRSLADRFVSSPASVAVISLLAALLVALGVSTQLRHGRKELRRRIGEFVTVAQPRAETPPTNPQPRLSEQALGLAERQLQRMGWWENFREETAIAEFPIAPVPLVFATAAVTLLLALLLGSLSFPVALFSLAVPLVVRMLVKRRLRERRTQFAEQLPDNLLVLAASLRAGKSFVGGFSAVIDETEEPSRSELRRAVADEQLGVPIEEALLRVARRMENGDLEQVALVAALQRETGGNTAEVLDTVVETVRARVELRRLVHTLSAEGRLSQWILTGLPIGIGLIIAVLNPGYLKPLFTTTGGEALLALAVGLIITGFVVIRRILDFEL